MSGMTSKHLWAIWYESSETVLAKVKECHPDCSVLEVGDVIVVPPHSIWPLDLNEGMLYVTHETNAIVKVTGSNR